MIERQPGRVLVPGIDHESETTMFCGYPSRAAFALAEYGNRFTVQRAGTAGQMLLESAKTFEGARGIAEEEEALGGTSVVIVDAYLEEGDEGIVWRSAPAESPARSTSSAV